MKHFVQSLVPGGMNNLGTIVGAELLPTPDGGETSVPFVWTKHRVLRLEVPSGVIFESPNAINDRGQITANMLAPEEAGVPKAAGYIWRHGRFEPMGDLPGGETLSGTAGENQRGQAVGFSSSDVGQVCVLWDHGTLMSLGDVPGGGTECRAEDINDFGVVVGSGVGVSGEDEPFVWRNGEMTLLPVPAGGTFGDAGSINNRGLIIGSYVADGRRQMSLWFRGEQLTIPPPPGFTRGALNAINDAGDIVGIASGDDFSHSAAILWHHLTPVDLNSRIWPYDPLKSCAKLGNALNINDVGEIEVYGNDSCAGGMLRLYRLVPVRERHRPYLFFDSALIRAGTEASIVVESTATISPTAQSRDR
jgi:uncharacterized membrane protein